MVLEHDDLWVYIGIVPTDFTGAHDILSQKRWWLGDETVRLGVAAHA